MTGTDLLRASRDGDQFHYHWAARQSLKLLLPGTKLTAIAVEGVSLNDTDGDDGGEVIDIAEYYGAASLRDADRVIYRQLKHSTVRADEEWTVSGLSKTVAGFAEKFRQIKAELPGVEEKVRFDFLSNRPIRSSVTEAIEQIASRAAVPKHPHEDRYLRQYAGFVDDPAGEAAFFSRLSADPTAPGLLSLAGLFQLDLAGFLPGSPDVEHVLLREMVTRRATSLETDNLIVKSTVLTALRTPPDQILPAPNLIAATGHPITTAQLHRIVEQVARTAGRPVIVHAAGGVGKSVFATQIGHHLPPGSLALVYDCFGNGGYRAASTPRHQHRQALVQLSNELAARTLCHPLLPSPTAQRDEYCRAFAARVRAAAQHLSAASPGALLALVIDAADNAALYANDLGERAFAPDLLRESYPDNVRLITLCRTERVDLLDPPPQTLRLQLEGFGTRETKRHLQAAYGTVSDAQVEEFHRRTGGNPRVQAQAIASAPGIDACLASLGEVTGRDGTVLDGLLQQQVDGCKDAHHGAVGEIDRLCEALAALRPQIPVAVLSQLCRVPPALVHSFAADLGRGLLVDGETLQFRDEPTETWFRSTFRPTGAALERFIERLLPLAEREPYVAASLPQLLWEAGRVDMLVALALDDAALPRDNNLEQREIAQQRAQYALKATLRDGREADAARLALKAGNLAAGHTRRRALLRGNTDLAGAFLDPHTVEEIVATRGLAGSWPGSNLHYEGAMLSAANGQRGQARSRLRSAEEWLLAWVRLPHEDTTRQVRDADVAEIGFGLLNTDGVSACARHLARWRPKQTAFAAGLIIANRLADTGRVAELETLGRAAQGVKHLQLAVACAAWDANLICSRPVAQALVSMLRRQRKPVRFAGRGYAAGDYVELKAVAWIVAMGLRHKLLPPEQAERILRRQLPTSVGPGAGSRLADETTTLLLCGFALLAKARGEDFHPDDVAGLDLAEARRHPHAPSRDLLDHRRVVTPLAAWASLWTDCLLEAQPDISARFGALAAADLHDYPDYETPYVLIRGAARLGPRILALAPSPQSVHLLRDWYAKAGRHISTEALIDAARAASPSADLGQITLELAQRVRGRLNAAHENAEYKAEQLVNLARAVYRYDAHEARAYFTDGIEIADRIGEDVHAVWRALLTIARASCADGRSDACRAYRVAQLIEALAPYVGDHAENSHVLCVIAQLSATTATAVASRWRDRRFYGVPTYVQALSEEDSPLSSAPAVPLALLPFGSVGDSTLDLTVRAMRHAPTGSAAIARAVAEFTRRNCFSAEAFARLDHGTRELRVDLGGTALAPAARHITPTPRAGNRPAFLGTPEAPHRAARRRQLEADLARCDLTSVDGWSAAGALIKNSGHQLNFNQAVERACQVPPSQLRAMLAAFQAVPSFSVHDYAKMINRLSVIATPPRAAQAQMRDLAQSVTRRYCRELTTRSYDPIDLRTLAALADTRDERLLGAALTELGSSPLEIGSEECYELAGRLARRLPADQAQIVFDDLSSMLMQVAPADFGDGPFEQLPAAPSTISECVAGYLWAALGDPQSDTRWRAAHCVRLMAELDLRDELVALSRFALGTLPTAPFVDARLYFYELHARQWLLLAIARAAQDPATHSRLTPFTPLMIRVVVDDVPHAVMQDSARRALLALNASGAVELTHEQVVACQRVNAPARISREAWRARADHQRDVPETTEPGFRFFMDFRAYWCRPLGQVFGLSERSVERLAGQMIIERWALPCRGERDQDARHTLNLYGDEKTHVYKSEWPTAEDLETYLAVHALWSVAAELARTEPVCIDDDAGEGPDQYTWWLRSYLISRDDGRWLSDRRDFAPPSIFDEQDSSADPCWARAADNAHFAHRLLPEEGWATVWEDSYDASYDAAQRVFVRSVMTAPDKARALVLALQTAPATTVFNLNDHDGGRAGSGFELTGWILTQDGRDGLDRRDPLAGAVRYPPVHPSEAVVELLGLKPDKDLRAWKRDGKAVMRSTVWDETNRYYSTRETGYQGERLEIRLDVLCDLLKTMGRSLIVEVMIERTCDEQRRTSSNGSGESDDGPLPRPSDTFRIYLFDDAGAISEF